MAKSPRNMPVGPSPFALEAAAPLAIGKFSNPLRTANGGTRANVPFVALETLWFNTGTLCNLACTTCYIESSPTNDALVYLKASEVAACLDEIAPFSPAVREIGFTGGEPFMNPDMIAMLHDALARGYDVLVLTNAMKPMRRHEAALLELRNGYGNKLTLRVSLDHYTAKAHDAERGSGSFAIALDGLRWLAASNVSIAVAGRHLPNETDGHARAGYAALFAAEGIALDMASLILFPEMDAKADVPEITTACWSILNKNPADIMCATSRMVVHRKGEPRARVAACTLLPYEADFDMGNTVTSALRPVALNHPHCARFCVLGGASCSA
jgi:sulfatase maturation enzyme AslB (radical SAM superfamily)